MNYLKTLSILCSSLFLFGCTREVPSSQLGQSSLSSSAQPVQSSSDSVSPSVSSQASSENPSEVENGPIPQMLENGWHYTNAQRQLYGWVKGGQEFVFCHDSMLDFYGLDNQFLRSVPFDSSQLPEKYNLLAASNRIFILESSLYDVPHPINLNYYYEPLLYEKDGQEYLSGVTMLDLEGNILLQIPPLDVSQDKDGDFFFSLDGEPVSIKPAASVNANCINDDLIFLSLRWYENEGLTSHTELYYFVPSKNKLTCIGKNFEDGYVWASNCTNACLFFYRTPSSPKNGLLFHVGYLDQNGVQYPYPGMLFSDAAMDGNSIYLSYSPYNLEYENYKFWRASPDDFILHNISFPEMEEPSGAYIPIYRAKVYLIDENYMLFDNRAFNIVTGKYGINKQAIQLYYMTWKNAEYNQGTNSHYVAWASPRDSYGQAQGYFKIFPFPKTIDEKVYSGYRWDVEDILENMEDFLY